MSTPEGLDPSIKTREITFEGARVESPDLPDRVARVVRNAERGCFVMQALLRPVPVRSHARLNGAPLDQSGTES